MRERDADMPLERKLEEEILVTLVVIDANERLEVIDNGDERELLD
jgi:hypothetical protein